MPTLLAGAGAYGPAMSAYLERTTAQFSSGNAQRPDAVAAVIVEILTADAPHARVQTSSAASAFVSKLADLDGSAVQTMTDAWVHDSSPRVSTPTEPSAR